MRLFLSILLGVFLLTSLCTFATADSFSITLDATETELLLKDKIDPIEIIEFSSDLENWIPVARNYENQWETILHMPSASCICPEKVRCSGISTDQAMVLTYQPLGENRFLPKALNQHNKCKFQ